MAIVNKVAQSGLITLKLEEWMPPAGSIAAFDLAPHLFKGLLLREKDFRQVVAETDWSAYAGKVLAVYCSAEAIIPVWAYMLVAVEAQPHAEGVFFGSPSEVETRLLLERINGIDSETYRDARVVVKGCADREVPAAAFLELSRVLRPVVRSLMYGEPCSTVPVYKAQRP
jgi:hypothetical protein